jgi:hypothetical protein
MASLATQKGTAAGVALTYASAAGGGDDFICTGREYFHAKNASGGAITVTFTSGAASANVCSFGIANAAHDLAVVVGAGADRLIGPFSKDRFADANGSVHVTYSGVTSLTVAVID